MSTAAILSAYEACQRRGVFARDWERQRLSSTRLLDDAIRAGLTSAGKDFGIEAGEAVMELGATRGIVKPHSGDIYGSIVHHAALADMVTSALRRPRDAPWQNPLPTTLAGAPWTSGAYLDPSGEKLRRVVLVSHWTDQRHYEELRSWHAIGEICAYRLPMQMAVVVVGQHRDGRRSGPWTKGFLHPQNHKLRFRKKKASSSEVFSDKWEQVWREDRGDIENQAWLQAMLEDDILRDVLFKVEIPVPPAAEVERIRAMVETKLARLTKDSSLPEANLSVCAGCPFEPCCWSTPEHLPRPGNGYVKMGVTLGGTPDVFTR